MQIGCLKFLNNTNTIAKNMSVLKNVIANAELYVGIALVSHCVLFND